MLLKVEDMVSVLMGLTVGINKAINGQCQTVVQRVSVVFWRMERLLWVEMLRECFMERMGFIPRLEGCCT